VRSEVPIRASDSSDTAESAADDSNLGCAPTQRRRDSHYDPCLSPQSVGEKIMGNSNLHAALIAVLAGLALGACDRGATGDERTVGQKLDRAVDKTQQKLAEAGEKTKEAIRESAPKVEQQLNAAGERIAVATDKVVDKTKEVARDATNTTVAATQDVRTEVKSGDTGRAMSDTAITASVKTDLIKDPDLSVLKIDVDTKDGVVTLNGLAGNEAAKQRAEKMAASVKGVKEVRNFLTVKRA
jgi:osmotically-inducible protein OsmY